MPKHNPMDDEQPTTLANPPNAVPSWDREALALKIQSVDECTPDEAKRQVDVMAKACASW